MLCCSPLAVSRPQAKPRRFFGLTLVCVIFWRLAAWPEAGQRRRTYRSQTKRIRVLVETLQSSIVTTWHPPDGFLCAAAQIHITQGATPADMYISWATGNAVYTYCSESDSATCGDKKNACECNQTPPSMTSSQVKYGTDSTMATFEIGQDAGTYPVVVSLPPSLVSISRTWLQCSRLIAVEDL